MPDPSTAPDDAPAAPAPAPAAPTIRASRYEVVPVDSIEPHPRNVNEGDVGAICESMDALGFYGACLVQESTGLIIAGKHRWLAARAQGMDTIPVLFHDVDDDEAERMMLSDNRIARLGRDDPTALHALLTDMASRPMGLTGTGFDGDDLELLRRDIQDAPPIDPDADTSDGPTVMVDWENPPHTQPEQIWVCGDHRVMRGDSRNPAHVARLLDGAAVNVAFTSPPYASQRAYDQDSGFEQIPEDEYVAWFAPVAENVAAHLAADGSWFVNIKPNAADLDTSLYVLDLVVAHVRQWGWHFATEFCWERNGVPCRVARRFKNQYEPIYQFARGDWKIRPDAVAHWSPNAITALGEGASEMARGQGGSPVGSAAEQGRAVQLGSLQRGQHYRGGYTGPIAAVQGQSGGAALIGEVVGEGMAYPGNRLPTFMGSHDATGHSAAFPVGLPAWFARAFSDEGDVVFDPFLGSGSTVLAAEREGRRGYGMDCSGRYVDAACKRFHAITGITPVDAETGEPFPIGAD